MDVPLLPRNLRFAGRGANRLFYSLTRKLNCKNCIIDGDWDVLILFDACRYDVFREKAPDTWPNASPLRSAGSNTIEFLEHNISDQNFNDTVYITANPQLENFRRHLNTRFHAEAQLWAREDMWDDTIGTVPPETVVETAMEYDAKYPHKRLLIHFIQPHYPFRNADFDSGSVVTNDDKQHFWHRLMTGDLMLPRSELRQAYNDNVDWVLDATEDLPEKMIGKVVVTSDHGNMLGDRSWPVPTREYGHPKGIYTPELVRVPWVEFEPDEEREVVAESVSDRRENTADVNEKLRALAYK